MAFSPFRNYFFNQPPSPTFKSPYLTQLEEDDEGYKTPQPIEQQQPNFSDAFRELLLRKPGPAMTAYQKFLEQGHPDPSQFKPGKLNRIAAILAGAASGFVNPATGPKVARDILEHPYERASERYKLEGTRLASAADLEEKQHGRDIQSARELRQAENERIDNERQERVARNLIETRNANLEVNRQRAEAAGMFFELDKNTGIGYVINKNTMERKPVGKFDVSTGERIDNEKEKAKYLSELTFGRSAELQKRGFRQQERMQEKRTEDQIKVLREKANLPNTGSVNQRIKGNLEKVKAMVSQNPELYTDVWDSDNEELNEDMVGTPEYEAIRKQLYSGFSKEENKDIYLPPEAKTTPPKGRARIVR